MTPGILFVFGTRPEAIKLCPLIRHLRRTGSFRTLVCTTGQHRELFTDALRVFDVTPDFDLAVMRSKQSLIGCASRILAGLEQVIRKTAPQWVVVQGDTTSTLCGGLAGFYSRIPVAHVEAGLRTGDMHLPFPEEMHRVVATSLASAHFAATTAAAQALEAEGVSRNRIEVTGNTGIDALLEVKSRLERGEIQGPDWSWLDPRRRLVVATAHRRESFGLGIDQIAQGLRRLAERPDVQLVCLPHPNPAARRALVEQLRQSPARLLEPLAYASFVDLLRRAHFVVSDSGGIQEEAPALGVPVLVLREVTERPEAVESGSALLVGSSAERLLDAAGRLLEDQAEYERRSRVRLLYGD
jgi:UDP-N-acetylglucosamine 2-epimerase